MSPRAHRSAWRRLGGIAPLLLAACAGTTPERLDPDAGTSLQWPLRLADFVRGDRLQGYGLAPFRVPARDSLEAAVAAGSLTWQFHQGTLSVLSSDGGEVGAVRVHTRRDAEADWPTADNVLAVAVRPAPSPGEDVALPLAALGVRPGELLAVYRYGSVLLWRTNVPGVLVATPATDGLLREGLPEAAFELLRAKQLDLLLDQESLTAWSTLQEWAAAGELRGLLQHAEGLLAARRQGAADRVDALLHAALATDGRSAAAWRQLGATWRLAEQFGAEATGLGQRWRAELERRARAAGAAWRETARTAKARGLAGEADWLADLADDVDALAVAPAMRNDRGEAVADVVDVLVAAAEQVQAAVDRGGFGPDNPPDLDRTVGLTQTQADTAAFRSWSQRFAERKFVLTAAIVAQREAEQLRVAALREAEERRVAAQQEAERQRLAAARSAAAAAAAAYAERGLLALAAETWSGYVDRPAEDRALLDLWTASDRDTGSAAVLQLLAKLLPFVPSTDPDAERLYRASRERLLRSPLADRYRLSLGSDAEAARFGALTGAEPVVPLLYALDDELRSNARADHRVVTDEREVLIDNPALEGWRDQVGRRQGDVARVDQAIRDKAGIAPSDPGFDTWLRLNPNARELLEPLLELRREAVASAWYAGSVRPPAQVASRIRSERLVRTVRQDWNGFVARTLGLLAGEVYVTERIEHTIRSSGHQLKAESEFGAQLESQRIEDEVASSALAELNRRTAAALPGLLQKLLLARADRHLAAGRRSGWTEAEVAAEAQALARLLDLPGTPGDWAAVGEAAPELGAALATQIAPGGGLRQASTFVPVLPPLEQLQLLCELTGAWSTTDLGDTYRLRMSPSLRFVVALDDQGVAFAVDLQQRTEVRGDAAAVLWRDSIDPSRRFGVAAWLREVPDPLPDQQLSANAPDYQKPGNVFLICNPLPRYTVSSGLRTDLPSLQGEVLDLGIVPGGRQKELRVATLDPGGEVHKAGTLLLGRLAWTLSRLEDGQSSIDLWDSLDGRRLFRFAPAQELLILEPYGAIVALHWERRRGDGREVRTVQVWALQEGR